VPESGPYRVREALSRRGQFEVVTGAPEEDKSAFALDGCDMAADSRGSDTQFSTRRRQILVPGGDFEDDPLIRALWP
jgi:hypothetical protein